MNAFVAHPSVRIKGTENNYDPVQCFDGNCSNKAPHMHCPFCVRTDSFIDPVILRAHYRVKHVDKGIEFAGLKILRCCDHCDIVGAIKGAKEFKGAHWHCYRCKNGFNRRDEAIKHYRTHFRNPQTTFQIQISQEVNQGVGMAGGMEGGGLTTETIVADDLVTIHPAFTEAIMTSSPADTLAANETVGTTGQTIMIIQEEQHMDNGESLDNSISITPMEYATVDRSELEAEIANLKTQNKLLHNENKTLEQQRTEEVSSLRLQLQTQAEEIERLQKREQELLAQLSVPLDDRIQELLQTLKSEHEDLLHQQLAQLRRTYLASSAANSYFVITKGEGDMEDYAGHSIVMISNDEHVATSMAVSHVTDTEQHDNSKALKDESQTSQSNTLPGSHIQIQITAPTPEPPSPSDPSMTENAQLDLVMVSSSHADDIDSQDSHSADIDSTITDSNDALSQSPPTKRKKL